MVQKEFRGKRVRYRCILCMKGFAGDYEEGLASCPVCGVNTGVVMVVRRKMEK